MLCTLSLLFNELLLEINFFYIILLCTENTLIKVVWLLLTYLKNMNSLNFKKE